MTRRADVNKSVQLRENERPTVTTFNFHMSPFPGVKREPLSQSIIRTGRGVGKRARAKLLIGLNNVKFWTSELSERKRKSRNNKHTFCSLNVQSRVQTIFWTGVYIHSHAALVIWSCGSSLAFTNSNRTANHTLCVGVRSAISSLSHRVIRRGKSLMIREKKRIGYHAGTIRKWMKFTLASVLGHAGANGDALIS